MSKAWSGEVRIAYEVRGQGKPLLFVHGLGYDRRGWGPLPGLLMEDFRVLLIDNRGVGESDFPDGPYTVAEMAADAVAALDAACVEHAHVLGVSLGGFIAQELALSYPGRVDRLVLCSTSPGGPNQHPMPAAGVEAFGRFPTLEREAGLRLMVENSLGEHAVRERPELVEEVYAYRLERAPPLEAWQAQLAAASRSIPTTACRRSRLRPSCCTAKRTRSSTPERRASRRPDPGAQLHVVPGRGHLLVYEEAELVAPIVRDFLRS